MFSNLKRAAAVFLTVVSGAAAFSGCGLKIGERPNQDTIVELGSAQTACLSGASHTLADYFHGKASDNQISSVFSCASNSLKLFQERTRGARPGIYSPAELKKFLTRYFLRDFLISDALMEEFMELKKTLLGGSTDELTMDELDRLRSLLDTLRDVVVRLRPYLPLTPDHVKQLSDDDVNDTIKALREAADALGKILEERASPYEFYHLDRLLAEVEKFLQDDDYVHDTAEFRKYIPLFISIKKIAVSPDGQRMAGKDWRVLISRSADLYGMLLRVYRLYNNEPTLISGVGRVRLMSVSESAYQLLREVVVSNPGETVSFCNIYDAIDEASKLFGYPRNLDTDEKVKAYLDTLKKTDFKDYPSHLKVYLQNQTTEDDEDYLRYFKYGNSQIYRGTIKKFLLPLVQKYLRPVSERGNQDDLLKDYLAVCKSSRGVDNNTKGVRAENLDRLWNFVTRVSENQIFLEKIFLYAHENYFDPGNPLQIEVSPSSLLAWLPGDPSTLPADTFKRALELLYQVPQGSLSKETLDSAKELSQLAYSHLPLFKENDARINFDNNSPVGPGERAGWRQSFVGLSALGAISQVVRQTWDAYVADPARIDQDSGRSAGISKAELNQFYLDVREIGIAFKLFDPNSMSAADSRFLEGNLFTYASNGDSYLSLAEGTDLVAFLYSGKGLSTRTYSLVHDRCVNWTVGCPDNQPGCHIGEKDVYGKDKISTQCFNHFAMGELYPQLWDHMPNLSEYYTKKLDALGDRSPQPDHVYRETFACLVETVARTKGADSKWINSGDVDQISALEHYLEAMFVRYDANHFGTLDRDEALRAYPVLKKVIGDEVKKRVSFLTSDKDLQAVLTYILAYGTIPSTDDWKSILDFGIWRYIHESNFDADRARVVQVMAAITGANVSGCYINPNVLPDARIPMTSAGFSRRAPRPVPAVPGDN
jgi:hypothetical protein